MPEVRIDNGQVTQPLIDEELAAFDELIQEVLGSTDGSDTISIGDEYFQGLPEIEDQELAFRTPPEITEAQILRRHFTSRPPLPAQADSNSDSSK